MTGNEVVLAKEKGVFAGLMFLLKEGGYFHLQGTKPDTLGMYWHQLSNPKNKSFSYQAATEAEIFKDSSIFSTESYCFCVVHT